MPTAVITLKSKKKTSAGVIRLPPPMPVKPTSRPIRSPVSVSSHVIRGSLTLEGFGR